MFGFYLEKATKPRTQPDLLTAQDENEWAGRARVCHPDNFDQRFPAVYGSGIIGLGGPFQEILGYGFLISLNPGFLALLVRK
jgi:hypothetical protein